MAEVALTESILTPPRLNIYLTPEIALVILTIEDPVLEQTVGSVNAGYASSNCGLIVITALSVNNTVLQFVTEPVMSKFLTVTRLITGLSLETGIEMLAVLPEAVTESILTPPKLKIYLIPAIVLLKSTVPVKSFEHIIGSENTGRPGERSGFIIIIDLSVNITVLQFVIEPVTSNILVVTELGTGLSLESGITIFAVIADAVAESTLTPPRLKTYLTPAIALVMFTVAEPALEHIIGSEKAG